LECWFFICFVQPLEGLIFLVQPGVNDPDAVGINVPPIGFFLICQSNRTLGNGIISNIHDMFVVDAERFDRSQSRVVASEIAQLNEKFLSQKRPYLLIGVGRWGTLDPWLGIPVKYDQICGARVIVEAGLRDVAVSPSQGSHFFQNITSFMVGYFTVQPDGFVDWKWINSQNAEEEKQFVKLFHFEHPIIVKMNGHSNKGIILKPNSHV
jgi:hypothetical protein